MEQAMANYREIASRYTVERSFSGERNAQEVIAALVRAHS